MPIAIGVAQDGDEPARSLPEIESHVGDRPPRPTAHKLVCTPARRPANFRLYGDCEPPAGEGGCAAPLEVQVIPACERNVAQYEHRPRIKRRRGVPSAEMDRQLELYTADSTVVIFSGDAALARRATRALQPLRRGVAPAALPPKLVDSPRLSAPVRGALSGDLRCDARR